MNRKKTDAPVSKLQELRLLLNKSQVQIASKLNISRKYLSSIENKEKLPSLPLAKKIADFYNANIEDIFF